MQIYYAPRKISGEHVVPGLSVHPSVTPSIRMYVPNSCPSHNFVIWSRILQLFHRNNHHIETTCRAQHLGCFYTLNFDCDITLTLQEVYLPVSKTYSGSITWFNRLMYFEGMKWCILARFSTSIDHLQLCQESLDCQGCSKALIRSQFWAMTYYPAILKYVLNFSGSQSNLN
jgi:hypothetical protein